MVFISTISHSKRDYYKLCPFKFEKKYVEKMVLEDFSDVSPMNYGSYIHKIFENGVDKSLPELLELSKLYRDTWKFDKSFDKKTKKCLENFVELNKKLTKTLSTEFSYEILLCEKSNINHNGIIDRIVEGKNGGLLVIDYKTGKREKTRVELITDTQLMGYTLAVHKMYQVPINKIRVAHYYPITNHLVDVQYGEPQISKFIREVISDVWDIRKKKKGEFPPIINKFCNNCNYKPICPKHNDNETIKVRLDELTKKKD